LYKMFQRLRSEAAAVGGEMVSILGSEFRFVRWLGNDEEDSNVPLLGPVDRP
jgi:hypothetical protein